MPNDVLLSKPSEAVSTSTIRYVSRDDYGFYSHHIRAIVAYSKRARDVEEESSSISSSMAHPLEPFRYYKKLKSSVDLFLSTISGHEQYVTFIVPSECPVF